MSILSCAGAHHTVKYPSCWQRNCFQCQGYDCIARRQSWCDLFFLSDRCQHLKADRYAIPSRCKRFSRLVAQHYRASDSANTVEIKAMQAVRIHECAVPRLISGTLCDRVVWPKLGSIPVHRLQFEPEVAHSSVNQCASVAATQETGNA